MNTASKAALFFIIVILIGCSSNDASKEEVEISEIKITKEFSAITGTIISIDSTKFSNDENSPCSKAPCWAQVKVNSVVGRGQGGPFISVNDTLNVHFTFTLAETTEELIPNLDKRMPGLKINDGFEANIKAMANNNMEKLYEVYYYTKK